MTSIVVIYDYFYLLVRLCLGFPPFCFETGEELPSVVSSMLFTVHPVHVEVGVVIIFFFQSASLGCAKFVKDTTPCFDRLHRGEGDSRSRSLLRGKDRTEVKTVPSNL